MISEEWKEYIQNMESHGYKSIDKELPNSSEDIECIAWNDRSKPIICTLNYIDGNFWSIFDNAKYNHIVPSVTHWDMD